MLSLLVGSAVELLSKLFKTILGKFIVIIGVLTLVLSSVSRTVAEYLLAIAFVLLFSVYIVWQEKKDD